MTDGISLIEDCWATCHLVRSTRHGDDDSPIWLRVADVETLLRGQEEGDVPSEHEKEWLAKDDAFVDVRMDAGVYHWLADMIAAKHRTQHYSGLITWYQDLVDRAHEQFQAAANPGIEENGDEPPTRRRVIHRRVAKRR